MHLSIIKEKNKIQYAVIITLAYKCYLLKEGASNDYISVYFFYNILGGFARINAYSDF